MRLVILLFAFVIISCNTSTPTAPDDSQSVDRLFEDYHQTRLNFYPLEATFAGDNRLNDTLPNSNTADYRVKLEAFYSGILERAKAIDSSTLTDKDLINLEVLIWECETNLEQLKYPTHLTPINQFYSTNLIIGQLASGKSAQPFKTVEDYDNWISRVEDFILWTDSAEANMKKGMASGYVLPKTLIKKVVPQLEDMTLPVESHLFYQPILNMPETFGEVDSNRLAKEYQQLIEVKVIPTFRRLANFMKTDYLEAGRESTGIAALPNGEEYYNLQIKIYTTTDMTADEIFNLGKKEVARIESEMQKVMDEVGFEGSLQEFFAHLDTLSALKPYDRPEDVIAHYEQLHDKMKPNIDQLFEKLPKTEFEVRRTEAFREKSASAEYNPGTTDGSRPGVFYVPIPDVENYSILSAEDLFLHEAIPGHHFQISLQQEDTTLPEFRKTLFYSAFGEGWALYSESLGKELGLYEDPYQYFGMLSADMHRAVRLVVDAGMHAKGWTREEAIAYCKAHEPLSEEGIIAEIERYMSWPGQALSYKIGQQKILELRERAKDQLGEAFDIKEFHTQILETGCVPLKVLEYKIDEWINSQRAG